MPQQCQPARPAQLLKPVPLSGQNLQRTLDSAANLEAAASANVAPTIGLINALQPVLRTHQAGAGDIRWVTRDLAGFTGQLAHSDADLRGTLEQFPPFLDQFRSLLNHLRPTVPELLANLTSVDKVAGPPAAQLDQRQVQRRHLSMFLDR